MIHVIGVGQTPPAILGHHVHLAFAAREALIIARSNDQNLWMVLGGVT